MSGYAPLFSSLTTGTLCGRWPDIGLWPIVLSLADRYGAVDVTPDYLSRVTGLQIEAVTACMERFCEPDQYSRSDAEEGRRLVLLDPDHRKWGWRVVNATLYRERARLMAKAQREVTTGSNQQRLSSTADDRRSPPVSPDNADDPLLNNTKQDKSKRGAPKSRRVPEDFNPDRERALADIPDIDIDREIQKFRDWEFKTPRSDWAACWRTWIGNCRDSGKYAKRETVQWR